MKTLAAGLLGLMVCVTQSQAAAVVQFLEVGSDVIATLTGSLDLTGMTPGSASTIGPTGVQPIDASLAIGTPGSALVEYADQITGPSTFGSGLLQLADSSTGDGMFLYGNLEDLLLPASYLSGGSLNASMTFIGESISTLGASLGDYVYTLGSGDTLTVRFGAAAAVPTPATLPLAALALLALAGSWRRRSV